MTKLVDSLLLQEAIRNDAVESLRIESKKTWNICKGLNMVTFAVDFTESILLDCAQMRLCPIALIVCKAILGIFLIQSEHFRIFCAFC